MQHSNRSAVLDNQLDNKTAVLIPSAGDQLDVKCVTIFVDIAYRFLTENA